MRGETGDLIVLDNDCAVVTRRMRIKDAFQEWFTDLSFQLNAARDMASDGIFAFDNDQGADLILSARSARVPIRISAASERKDGSSFVRLQTAIRSNIWTKFLLENNYDDD
jgi:hypothetical protein